MTVTGASQRTHTAIITHLLRQTDVVLTLMTFLFSSRVRSGLNSPATRLFALRLAQVKNNETTKALHYWGFVRWDHGWLIDPAHRGPTMQKACPCYGVTIFSQSFWNLAGPLTDNAVNSCHRFQSVILRDANASLGLERYSDYRSYIWNQSDIKRRNTIGGLDQYTCIGLRQRKRSR